MSRILPRACFFSLGLHVLLLFLLLMMVSPDHESPAGGLVQVRMWQVLPERTLIRRTLVPPRVALSQPTETSSVHVPVVGLTVAALPIRPVTTALPLGGATPHLSDSLNYVGEGAETPKLVSAPRQPLSRTVSRSRPQVVRPRPTLRLHFSNPKQLALPTGPLERIALDVVDEGNSALDMVFLIDASQSMEDNIRAVARHLDGMVLQLEQGEIDARLGVIAFRHSRFFSMMGWDIEFLPLTRDFDQVKRMIQNIECLGGERALDAILIALERVEFRKDTPRRMILVTDEYLSGEVRHSDVLRAIQQQHVQMDVIGRDEPFQKRLASASKGIWQSIEAVGR